MAMDAYMTRIIHSEIAGATPKLAQIPGWCKGRS